MNDKPFTLLVLLEAKSGKEQELKTTLYSLVGPTLEEEGCINYVLHESLDNPAKFMFYESWSSKEAHARHIATPHIQAWRAKRDELLARPSEVTFWENM